MIHFRVAIETSSIDAGKKMNKSTMIREIETQQWTFFVFFTSIIVAHTYFCTSHTLTPRERFITESTNEPTNKRTLFYTWHALKTLLISFAFFVFVCITPHSKAMVASMSVSIFSHFPFQYSMIWWFSCFLHILSTPCFFPFKLIDAPNPFVDIYNKIMNKDSLHCIQSHFLQSQKKIV